MLDPASVKAHLGHALWYHAAAAFGVLQLIWPDAKGAFPDAPMAPDWLQKTQPMPA